MERQSRRGVLAGAAKAAAVAAGGVVLTGRTEAQTEKPMKRNATAKPGAPPLPFTPVVGFGNLLFVSGIGCRIEGTIEQETAWVLDEIERYLVAAGSSLEKVLRVGVYLEDMKEFDRMNAVYKTRRWGAVLPARNTVEVSALPAGDHGLAIECVASL